LNVDSPLSLAGPTTGIELSPTAKLTADLRRHSDIPFAAAIAELTDAADFARGMPGGGLPDDVRAWMAPLIEARYKCLTQAIERSGHSQVLELAGGFAFRGLAMVERSALLYLDTDLPGLHAQRQAIRAMLERDEGLEGSERCLFAGVDLLNRDDVDRAAALLRPGEPVAIVQEGIIPYLTADEKHVAAGNVARLLRRFGGVWLTPDFKSGNDGIERLWRSDNSQMVARYLGTSSGRTTPRDLSLSDEAKVRAFLASHGLVGEKRPAIPDLSILSSARSLGTGEDVLSALQSGLALWAIRRADEGEPD